MSLSPSDDDIVNAQIRGEMESEDSSAPLEVLPKKSAAKKRKSRDAGGVTGHVGADAGAQAGIEESPKKKRKSRAKKSKEVVEAKAADQDEEESPVKKADTKKKRESALSPSLMRTIRKDEPSENAAGSSSEEEVLAVITPAPKSARQSISENAAADEKPDSAKLSRSAPATFPEGYEYTIGKNEKGTQAESWPCPVVDCVMGPFSRKGTLGAHQRDYHSHQELEDNGDAQFVVKYVKPNMVPPPKQKATKKKPNFDEWTDIKKIRVEKVRTRTSGVAVEGDPDLETADEGEPSLPYGGRVALNKEATPKAKPASKPHSISKPSASTKKASSSAPNSNSSATTTNTSFGTSVLTSTTAPQIMAYLRMEEWEVTTGTIRDANDEQDIACSAHYLAENEASIDGIAIKLLSIRAGTSIQLRPAHGRNVYCTIITQQVQVIIGSKSFIVGPGATFEVKSGESCTVGYMGYKTAVVSALSVPANN